MNKKFKLSAEQIKPLIAGMGSCIATDMITVDGKKVGFMYREEPSESVDTGWRFMSGMETQEYMDNANNLEIYHTNTVANYDPEIIPLLDSPVGSAFERKGGSGPLIPVEFSLPDE
jgi:hypothetical protein